MKHNSIDAVFAFTYLCSYVHTRREADLTKERISKILDAGANVLLLTGGIDDMCMKYLVERGVMGVRRCRKASRAQISLFFNRASENGFEHITYLHMFPLIT